jgi:hypothetical protein
LEKLLLVHCDLDCDRFFLFVVESLHHLPESPLPNNLLHLIAIRKVVSWR